MLPIGDTEVRGAGPGWSRSRSSSWFVLQFFTGIAGLGAETAQTGGVAVWAHIGGFVFGLILSLLLRGRASRLSFESASA